MFSGLLKKSGGQVSLKTYGLDFVVFAAALLLSTWQLYAINAAGVYLSLGFVTCYACLLFIPGRFYYNSVAQLLVIFLFLIQAASLAWSYDKNAGIRDIIYEAQFLILFSLALKVIDGNLSLFFKYLKIFCAVMIVQSVVVVVFRFLPNLEAIYWRTPLAFIFINPNVLQALNEGVLANNALDPGKSGGLLYVNANIAGILAGVSLFLTLAAYNSPKDKFKRLFIAFFHLAAVLTCGSKASIMNLFLVTSACFVLYVLYNSKEFYVKAIYMSAFTFAGGVLYLLYKVFIKENDFVVNAEGTLQVRTVMWTHAYEQFIKNPLMGQGYGGWARSFLGVGVSAGYQDYPPHNAMIFLWSQSGLLAALVGLAFLITCVVYGYRTFRLNNVLLSFGLLGAFIFYSVQIMGENTSLISEPHCALPIAVAVAAMLRFGRPGKADRVLSVKKEVKA